MNKNFDIAASYDEWAFQYDEQVNKTRDVEAKVFREMLSSISFNSVLELGCGTGKNTLWLATQCQDVVAMDFSPKMLEKAKEKLAGYVIHYIEQDLNKKWKIQNKRFDLICCSLVLEHIENIEQIFDKAKIALHDKAFFYIGELHPFKQYSGSKARFSVNDSEHILSCYTHQTSDFLKAAIRHGFVLRDIIEKSEVDSTDNFPRILSMLFQKL